MRIVLSLLLFSIATGCSQDSEGDNDFYGDDGLFFTPKDFYREKNQINKYFIVELKNQDYLTPAAILSLRDASDVSKIPEYLGTLCSDYSWMHSKKVIHVFESSQYAKTYGLFLGKTERTMAKNLQREKYVAVYDPDELSITFFPLVREKEKKVYMDKEWCRREKGK